MKTGDFENERKNWIDACKGIAICGIILVHCNARTMPGVIGQLGFSGWSGVQIFFMISAFLTFQSLEHLKISSDFSISRRIIWVFHKIKKLMPMFYLGILIYLIILRGNESWLSSVGGKVTVLNIISHLTFTHSLFPCYSNSIMGVEWYLGDLVLLYLMSAILFKKINSAKKAFGAFVCSIIGSIILQMILLQVHPLAVEWIWDSYVGTIFFFTQLPSMMAGYLLYFLERDTLVKNRIKENKFCYAAVLISGIIIYFVSTVINQGKGQIILYTISYFLIIICMIVKPVKIVENKLFMVLGKNSYEIYIVHYLLIQLYEKKYKNVCQYNSINIIIEFVLILSLSFIITVVLKFLYRNCIIQIRSRQVR